MGNQDEIYVAKEALFKRGFDFDYQTHQVVSGQGNTFVLCFNYGYRVMNEGRLNVQEWWNRGIIRKGSGDYADDIKLEYGIVL